MYNEDNIKKFLSTQIGCGINEITSNVDIESELGCCGDDFHELIEAYAKRFNVDMSEYKWHFHTNEEGQNFGGLFFKAPYERVERISVTPAMLLEFANSGKWFINYPEHKLPKKRWDIIINQLIIVVILVIVIRSCIK